MNKPNFAVKMFISTLDGADFHIKKFISALNEANFAANFTDSHTFEGAILASIIGSRSRNDLARGELVCQMRDKQIAFDSELFHIGGFALL